MVNSTSRTFPERHFLFVSDTKLADGPIHIICWNKIALQWSHGVEIKTQKDTS